MKKIVFFIMLSAVAVMAVGCGGYRRATLQTNESGITVHTDTNLSFIQSSINPQELAEARAIVVQAEANASLVRALAKQIDKGKTASVAGEYIGIIINDDFQKTAYISHPEMSQRVKIAAGSYAILITRQIPDQISIYNTDGSYSRKSISKKNGTYNGVNYDYGLRINKL